MQTLAELDLIDLVGSLYEDVGEGRGWEPFLNKISRLFGGLVSLTAVDLRLPSGQMLATGGHDPTFYREYNSYFHSVDIFNVRAVHLVRTGFIGTSQQLCTDAELLASEVYNDFYRKWDSFYGAGVIIAAAASSSVGLYVVTPRRLGPLAEPETKMLGLLLPHMQRAWRIHTRLGALEASNEAHTRLTNRFGDGVILVDPEARILLVNDAAQRMLDARDGLLIRGDGIAALTSHLTAQIRRAISQACETAEGEGWGAGGVFSITRSSPIKRPYHVVISPLRTSQFPVRARCMAAIFINDPDRQPIIDSEAVAVL